ncbi:glycosyltransferase [Aliivibrio fischeri]|uniref:glycosyltransferase n=1 Tax=Aliivibrio fischeri TaxID=668 RepID=UPI0012DAF04D|nr:glycosyltransferase [Aliivibrio fischeri]MUJ26410.1 glycosyltransferase [Aliivibrio fischeri]
MSFKKNDFISIITVCFNDLNGLINTVDSVMNFSRNYKGQVFYFIIDGGSSDGTKEYLESMSNFDTPSNIDVSCISEKDSGIYDAMNKGVKLLPDDGHVLFLNSSDTFLENASEILNENPLNSDVIVYRVKSSTSMGQEISVREMKSIDNIKCWPCFPHQSTFISNLIMKKHYYDTNFSILADYDFFCKCYINEYSIQIHNDYLSDFKQGGVSNNSKFILKYIDELTTIQTRYFGKYSVRIILSTLIKALLRSNRLFARFELILRKNIF